MTAHRFDPMPGNRVDPSCRVCWRREHPWHDHAEPTEASTEVEQAHFAPMCRGGRHMPKQHRHNYAALTGKTCACPCHLGNEGSPWWTDLNMPAPDARQPQ